MRSTTLLLTTLSTFTSLTAAQIVGASQGFAFATDAPLPTDAPIIVIPLDSPHGDISPVSMPNNVIQPNLLPGGPGMPDGPDGPDPIVDDIPLVISSLLQNPDHHNVLGVSTAPHMPIATTMAVVTGDVVVGSKTTTAPGGAKQSSMVIEVGDDTGMTVVPDGPGGPGGPGGPRGPGGKTTSTRTVTSSKSATPTKPGNGAAGNKTGPIESSGANESNGFGEAKMVAFALAGVLGFFVFA